MGESTLDSIHPGEILLEEFLRPLGVSQNQLARDIDVPVSRIAGIVKGERAITADTALRLAQFFGTSPEMWIGLQSDYDLRTARRSTGLQIQTRVRALAPSAKRRISRDIGSSVIRRVEYDEQEQALFISFVSGLTYRYAGVPEIEYDALLAAESKGTFFNDRIKDRYPFTQVTARRGRGPRSAA